jgi:hypothetical protein
MRYEQGFQVVLPAAHYQHSQDAARKKEAKLLNLQEAIDFITGCQSRFMTSQQKLALDFCHLLYR